MIIEGGSEAASCKSSVFPALLDELENLSITSKAYEFFVDHVGYMVILEGNATSVETESLELRTKKMLYNLEDKFEEFTSYKTVAS